MLSIYDGVSAVATYKTQIIDSSNASENSLCGSSEKSHTLL